VADVQVKASFPGGEAAFREYVGSTFQYPVRCQDEGINGSVVLRFIVDQSGRVSKVSAIEETKSCPEFTDEAIRVLKKSPRWIPGQNKGRFVISWREIPIKLTIE
jgi:TonB family protein